MSLPISLYSLAIMSTLLITVTLPGLATSQSMSLMMDPESSMPSSRESSMESSMDSSMQSSMPSSRESSMKSSMDSSMESSMSSSVESTPSYSPSARSSTTTSSSYLSSSSEIVETPTTFLPTPSPSPVLSEPRNLSVVNVTASTIKISWDEPAMQDGSIRYYVIEYYKIENESSIVTFNYTSVNGLLCHELIRLSPYTNYTISVHAVTASEGPSTNITTATLQDVPGPVQNTTLIATSSDTFRVAWTDPSTLNGVLLYFEISYHPSLNVTDDISVNITPNASGSYQIELGNLIAYTEYNVSIQAFTVAGGGIEELRVERTLEGTPDPPMNVVISMVTSTTAILSWQAPLDPQGIIASYNVSYNQTIPCSGNVSSFEIMLTRDNFTYTFVDLEEATNYVFSVTVMNGVRESEAVSVTANTSESSPSSPPVVTAIVLSSTSINVSWTDPLPCDINGMIVNYTVRVDEEDIVVSDGERSRVLSNLTAFTNYTISVSVSTSVGRGPFSGTITRRTEEDVPGPVENFTLIATSSGTLEVSWTDPSTINGVLLYFEISYHPSLNVTDDISINITPNASGNYQTELGNLIAYTAYNVSIQAFTVAGGGIEELRVERTLEGTPDPPMNVVISMVTSTTAILSWQAPLDPQGIIAGYNVSYNQTIPCSGNVSSFEIILTRDNITYTFVDLEEATEYVFYVSVMNGVEKSEIASVTATTLESVPTSPPVVTAMVLSSTSINVSWTDPLPCDINGMIVNYTVRVDEDDIVVSDGERSRVLSNLTAFTNYTISVSVSTSVGRGPFSDTITRRTEEDVPGPVENFTLIATSSDTLEVSWRDPSTINGVLLYFEISYHPSLNVTDDISINITPNASGSYQIELGNLTAYTAYNVSIQAFTVAGGGIEELRVERTLEGTPDSPINVVISMVTSTTAILSWQAPLDPQGIIASYNVSYNQTIPCSGNVSSFELMLTRDNITYTFVDLEEATEYVFYVSVMNGVEESEIASVTATTLESVPTSPPVVTAIVLSSTSINVSWTDPPPCDINGMIVNYTVRVDEDDIVVSDGERSRVLSNLTAFTNYTISVAVSTSVGRGPFSGTITRRTEEDVPGPVENFTLIATSSGTLEVSWTDPSTINGVLLYFEISYHPSLNVTDDISINITPNASGSYQIELGNLIAYTAYNVSIQAFTVAGGGIEELRVERTLEGTPDPPMDVVISMVTSTTAILSWQAPSDPQGIIASYNVSYNQTIPCSGNVSSFEIMLTRDNFTYTFVNLEEATNYVFSVTVMNGVRESEAVSVSANTSESIPSSPPIITAMVLSSTSINVSWTDPLPCDINGMIVNYTVRVDEDDIIVSDGERSRVLSNLTAFTNYTISVSVSTSVGRGPFSDTITRRTEEDVPGPVENFTLIATSSDTLEVSWRDPSTINGVLLYFEISYHPSLNVTDDISVNITPNASGSYQIELGNLIAYTEYNVSIQAFTVAGGGIEELRVERTLEGTPVPPMNVVISMVTSTTAILSWQAPLDPQGIIASYNVSYNQTIPCSGNVSSFEIMLTRDNLAYTFVDLEEATNYVFSVTVMNGVRESEAVSVTANTSESIPTSPPVVAAIVLSSTSINVSWTDPLPCDINGMIVNYTVRVDEDDIIVSDGERSRVLSNLTAFTNYTISVSVSTSVGRGPFSDTITRRTEEDVPGPVENFTLIATSSGTLEVSWRDPSTINGVLLYFEISYHPSLNVTDDISVNITPNASGSYQIELGNLIAYTEYNVSIQAFTVAGGGIEELRVERTLEGTPDPPIEVVISMVTSTTAILSWQAPLDPQGIIASYNVSYNQTIPCSGNVSSFEIMLTRDNFTYTFVDLEEATNYVFSVTVMNGVRESEAVSVSANTSESIPSSPPIITAMVLSSTSINVSWTDPLPCDINGMIVNYTVRVDEDDIIVSDGERSRVLSNLTAFTNYSISVAVSTSVGRGPFSDAITRRTEEDVPGSVENFTLIATSSGTLEVSWRDPSTINGVLLYFEISYHPSLDGTDDISVNITPNASGSYQIELGNLIAYTEYNVSIQAFTVAGGGIEELRVVRTLEGTPDPPMNVVISMVTSTTAILSWQAPLDPQGIIASYNVSYNQTIPCSGNVSSFEIMLTRDNFTYTFVNLEEATNYVFSVTVMNGVRESETVSVSANTSESIPTSPPVVTAIVLSSTSINVSWTDPLPCDINGMIVNYTVRVDEDDIIVSDGKRSRVLSNLTAFTNYTIRVAVSTSVGRGPFSDAITRRTEEDVPGPVENFTLIATSSHTLEVSWRDPSTINGVLLYFEISYHPSLNGTDDISVNITPNASRSYQIELGNLIAYTEYNVSIQAFTVAGGGIEELRVERTLEGTPDPPIDVVISMVTSTTAILSWQAPLDPQGMIASYNVSYNQTIPCSGNVSSFEIMLTRDNFTYTFVNLEEATNYVFSVTVMNGVRESETVSVSANTSESIPSSPPVVTAIVLSSTSINVSWTDPLPCDINGMIVNYTVRVDEDDIVVSDGERSRVLSNLTAFTNYTISVAVSTSVGRGPFSDAITRRTEEDAPSMPTNLKIRELKARSLSLEWGLPLKPNGVVRVYEVVYYVTNNKEANITIMNYTVTDMMIVLLTIESLIPYTSYTFEVRAITVEYGDVASIVMTTAEAAPTRPPEDVLLTQVTSVSINVSWEAPPACCIHGVLSNYSISVSQNGAIIMLLTSMTKTLVISGLTPYTNYTISVAAHTIAGPGPYSEPLLVQTNEAAPEMPESLSITVPNSTTIMVKWSPPIIQNGIIITYQIEYARCSSSNINEDTVEELNVTGSEMQSISGLEKFTMYCIRVRAFTRAGPGKYTSYMSVMTDPDAPSKPTHVGYMNVTEDSITVIWAEPENPNGVIKGYILAISDGRRPVNTSLDNLSYTFNNLNSSSEYQIDISAYVFSTEEDPFMVHNGMVETITVKTAVKSPPSGTPPTIDPNKPPSTVSTEPPVANCPNFNCVKFDLTIPELFTLGESLSYEVQVQPWTKEVQDNYRPFSEKGTYTDALSNEARPKWYVAISNTLKIATKRSVPHSISKRNAIDLGITLGSDRCDEVETCTNGPLLENTEYYVQLSVSNEGGSGVVQQVSFETAPAPSEIPSQGGVDVIPIAVAAVVVILVILVLVIVGVGLYCYFKSKRAKYSPNLFDADNTLVRNGDWRPGQAYTMGPEIVPINQRDKNGVSLATIITNPSSIESRKIALDNLPAHFANMAADQGYKFSEEYEMVMEVGVDHSKDASLMTENRAKNRYTNILAYDHSRVKLSDVDDEPGSDYINGNYIPGFHNRRAYIATQGPLPCTFDDFWRMVWEQNSYVIVMLTKLVERGRTKCHQYWPEQCEMYGDITVTMKRAKDMDDWVIREFELVAGNRQRVVTQLQFTTWPDHGVPDETNGPISFVREVRSYIRSEHGPIVVHCSAGVGRTGTFIAIDTLLQQIKEHHSVDIYGFACEMRQHRNHMIQTEAQYVFVHKAILHVVRPATFSIISKGNSTYHPLSPTLSEEYEYSEASQRIQEKYHTEETRI